MFSVKRVLVPIDFSGPSNGAYTYGTELAQMVGAQIYLLHVPGTTGENFEADFAVGPFERWAQERGLASTPQQAKDAAATPPSDRRPEFAIRIGSPAKEIARYAADRDIDLIVMGTHGRTGVAHAVMGSVAEQVLRSASCPVLVVRQPAHRS